MVTTIQKVFRAFGNRLFNQVCAAAIIGVLVAFQVWGKDETPRLLGIYCVTGAAMGAVAALILLYGMRVAGYGLIALGVLVTLSPFTSDEGVDLPLRWQLAKCGIGVGLLYLGRGVLRLRSREHAANDTSHRPASRLPTVPPSPPGTPNRMPSE